MLVCIQLPDRGKACQILQQREHQLGEFCDAVTDGIAEGLVRFNDQVHHALDNEFPDRRSNGAECRYLVHLQPDGWANVSIYVHPIQLDPRELCFHVGPDQRVAGGRSKRIGFVCTVLRESAGRHPLLKGVRQRCRADAEGFSRHIAMVGFPPSFRRGVVEVGKAFRRVDYRVSRLPWATYHQDGRLIGSTVPAAVPVGGQNAVAKPSKGGSAGHQVYMDGMGDVIDIDDILDHPPDEQVGASTASVNDAEIEVQRDFSYDGEIDLLLDDEPGGEPPTG